MPEPILTEPVAVFLTIMAVILITPLLSELARLPGIVGLMLGGMLIGPYGLNLLETGRTIELLSTVGLVYLMFNAGLEIDLNQFNRVRNKSMMFGFLTFIIPEISGIALGRLFGLDWAGSILLGSVYASHTLVAFPMLSRLGILRNESVSVTVGGTVFTSVLALLILAVIAGAEGEAGSYSRIVELIVLMIGYTFIILLGLPRLGKMFFRRFSGRTVEFQFVLVALFVAAFLADLIGMHAIVGAFLAGLAINTTIPSRSRVVGQVLFMGESFFIPIFLMYIGMILDPVAIVTNLNALLIGVALIAATLITKYLAAWITARIYAYSKDELFNMWGLSQAQAAATLVTVLVGVDIGLFSQDIFNGSILMVLFTVISSSLLVQRFGQRILPESSTGKTQPLFNRILVSIANPKTQEHLITLANILARTANGILYPVNVALEVQGRVSGLENQRRLLEADILKDPDTEVVPIARVDSSIAKGVLRTALEQDASLIVLGWRGEPTFRQSIFGTVLDEVVWNATVPVVVGRLITPINAVERVVLIAPRNSLEHGKITETVEMVTTIGEAINVPLLILSAGQYMEELQKCLDQLDLDYVVEFSPLGDDVVDDLTRKSRTHDLIVVTTTGSRIRFRSSLGTIPEQIAAVQEDSIIVIHYP